MKYEDMAKIISKCYDIQENDGNIAGCKEWAEAREAIDTAIFKAGYEQVWADGIIQQTFDEGKKAGIREVVEFIREGGYLMGDKWEAKVKEEWGIADKGVNTQGTEASPDRPSYHRYND